jgi:hypothetical protein
MLWVTHQARLCNHARAVSFQQAVHSGSPDVAVVSQLQSPTANPDGQSMESSKLNEMPQAQEAVPRSARNVCEALMRPLM